MANVILVTVYQLSSYSSPNPYQNGTQVGIGVGQIKNIQAVTGVPTVNGAIIYSVITMAGTTQFPGPRYYTGLTVYQIEQMTG